MSETLFPIPEPEAKIEAAAVQGEILQREAGPDMDALIVVDDRDLPARHRWRRRRGGLILEQCQKFGLFGHSRGGAMARSLPGE